MLPPGNSGLQVHRSTSVMLDAGMKSSETADEHRASVVDETAQQTPNAS